MNDSSHPKKECSPDAYEQRLGELLDAHGIVLAIIDYTGIDYTGICTFLNDGADRLVGLPPDGIVGKKLSELSAQQGDLWHAVQEGTAASIQRKGRLYREVAVTCGEKKVRLLSGFVPQADANGEINRIFVVLLDISDPHTSQMAWRDAERRRDTLLAILSHELRNPLATIRSGLKVLELSPHSPQAANARTMMERQLLHVVRLVNDLLDVSRINEGRLKLTQSKITVGDVVTLALEASGDSIKRGNHTLQVSLPEDSLEVNGDLTRLAQVVTNLLDNASKYTPNGGTISLNVFTKSNSVIFEVVDTGVGIPANKLDEIFQAYSQIEESRSHSRGGLGIGLYLVKTIVEAHGGRVEVASAGKSQEGSTFRVILPITTA